MDITTKKRNNLICPLCEKETYLDEYSIVDGVLRPDLREAIMSGEFFRWKCPVCNRRMKVQRPVLYYDSEKNFMIYMRQRYADNKNLSNEKIGEGYEELRVLKKRIVNDIASLKEKILVLEAGIDDGALELSKLALSSMIREKYSKHIRGASLTRFDEAENLLVISFQIVGRKEAIAYHTKLDLYNTSVKVVEAYNEKNPCENEFLQIGSAWAKEVLEWYQEEEKAE